MFYYQNWNYFYSSIVDYSLSYSTTRAFDIRNYTRKKESEINVLKLNIQGEGRCLEFDYFSRFIKRIPRIKELEISIDIKFQKEKSNPNSRIKEVLDFVIDALIPQYQDTLETITFTEIQIQEKSERDEEQTIKKYLHKMLQPLKELKVISFRQNLNEVKSSNFFGLMQFVLLLKEKSLTLPNLKLLDFEFQQTENQINLKQFNQKDIQKNMLTIAKDLSKINQLEELQIGIQNLGLEKGFFELLIQSIVQMKNLKKLGLDISSNRIRPENSVKNIKQLQSLSNQLENFIYIDSQILKPSNIKEFSSIMRNFSNLQVLQLEQFQFKQGHCVEFFSFFPFMPQLKEIKLDLESIEFSANDFQQFVKYVKQLENLISIQLTLPEEKKFLSENTVLNLADMITYFKDQLLELSLKVFENANYLTDFRCSYVENFDIMNMMIYERKVYILQNLIYTQIIQPQIIYQPQFSHLDIQTPKPTLSKLVTQQTTQSPSVSEYNGAYALVLKAENTQQKRPVALKFLPCTKQEDKNGIELLRKEYEILEKFSKSDFLVNVYDCFYLMEEVDEEDEYGNIKTIQTEEKSFSVMEMELCEQNFKQFLNILRKEQTPPPNEIKEIIAIQMLEGLNNLHVKNIMHRDIKPQNYLVCPSETYGFTIKICDLGFASAKGTDTYFAPEVEKGQSRIQVFKPNETQFEEYAQHLLDNTDKKVKDKDKTKQFTEVEVLSKLLKSLYQDKKYANNFQILSFGSYGMVLATKKANLNNKEIVLKIQKIVDDQAIENEITIMKKLREPLVVQLYDNYIIEKVTAPEKYVVFELEKCSCSLQDYIERKAEEGEFSNEDKQVIANQVIDCVNYIHCFNIIHRDIKPDNFLVCLDGNQPEIKLCDFGLSAQLGNSESIESIDDIGNLTYSAPEILTKNENENRIYSKKSDSYSVGLILCLIDNYLELNKKEGLTFIPLTSNKFDQPFEKQQINIKKDTEIFKFIKLLVVWDRLSRASLSDIVESNPKKYVSNELQMKQIKSISNVVESNPNVFQWCLQKMEQMKSMIPLDWNQICDAGEKDLGTGIAQCKNITTLTLNLQSNQIGDAGAKDLGTAIAQCKNITTLTLDLRNRFHSNTDEVYLYYSTRNYFNIRNYALIKESQISVLKLDLMSEEKCNDFDYFSKFINRIPNIKELEIYIDIKFHREKINPHSRVKEVFDFVIDTLIPQYQDTLETITFTQIQIQEKSEKDEEQTIKKFLLKILQPLKALKTLSFRQTITEAKSSIFYGLKQFIILLQEKQLSLSNLKLLDFEFKQEENMSNLKFFNSKEILNNMQFIAKGLSTIKQLEELQVGIQNLGLEKIFFEFLIQSVVQMKNLKKLGLDISSNRITVENSVNNVKQLQSLASQLESFIYIDSQNFKPSNVKEFNQVMKSFQNLKILQLEQFSFKQGLCSEFFQFLPFMPYLKEIKLDLENIYINNKDYGCFVKQVKQLENLTSIHLTLPEEKQYLSENTVFNLIDLITHFKDQLIDLSIEVYSDIKQAESEQLIDAISQLEQLKYFHFKFLIQEKQDSLILDARKQNAVSIWNLKSIKFNYQEYFYQKYVDFLIFLELRILEKQNSSILEDLMISLYYQINPLRYQKIQGQIVSVKKFNNLKTLIYHQNNSNENFKNISEILIQNNFNSLNNLQLNNNLFFDGEYIVQLIKNCKFLYHLQINIQSITSNLLDQIFSNLIYLQKLYINQFANFAIEKRVFQNANYLTDFKCTGVNILELMMMLKQRNIYILQNIIYNQIIQPQIIYQPQFSHLDIVID
ncbi:hypothetical protein ABPG74_001966 [Tetrahymena malaccensis]